MKECKECSIRLREGDVDCCGSCEKKPFVKKLQCVGRNCSHVFTESHSYKNRGNFCQDCIAIASKKYKGKIIDLESILS